jgi:hypothetical protein
MIISHKHKFIFFKPWKVGGNSVEYNLAKHCGKKDVINTNHTNPNDVIKLIGEKKYNKYFKFTVTRNPWDRMVSYFWWQDGGLIGKNHRQNINKLLKMKFDGYEFKEQFAKWIGNYTHFNEPYYFNKKGDPSMDHYMRFDNLDNEYKIVCEKLNIPYESLQNLGKFPYKKKNEEYWKYYNYESGSIVAHRHRKSIEKFNYTCGPMNT